MLMMALGATQASSPSLIARSKLVCATSGWDGYVQFQPSYHWLASDAILFFRGDGDRGWQLFAKGVRTGKEDQLKVSNLFQESGSGLGDVSPSPDGKFLLWSGVIDDNPYWYVARLDGSGSIRFPRRRVAPFISAPPEMWSEARWANDSRSVMETELDSDSSGAVIRVSKRSIADRGLAELDYPEARLGASHPGLFGRDLAIAADDDWLQPVRDRISFVSWTLGDPARTKKRWQVLLPSGFDLVAYSISPDGKGIAWSLARVRSGAEPHKVLIDSPTGTTQAELPTGYRLSDYDGIYFWTSTIEGTSWRSLGELSFAADTAADEYAHLSAPIWRPDGKAISFTYRDGLYVIAAAK